VRLALHPPGRARNESALQVLQDMKVLKRTLVLLAVATAVAVAGHAYLLDGLDGWLFARVMGDDTTYGPRYSDTAFREVRVGMNRGPVDQLLGPPLRELWIYRESGVSLPTVDFAGDRVVYVGSETDPRLQAVKIGMRKDEVLKMVGSPREVSLVYTKTPHDQSYRLRALMLAGDRVVKKEAEFYVD
jgi:outer membrane protein assembly factor BamE (lipoprotein component of BamABCDE complex)